MRLDGALAPVLKPLNCVEKYLYPYVAVFIAVAIVVYVAVAVYVYVALAVYVYVAVAVSVSTGIFVIRIIYDSYSSLSGI